MKKHLLSCLTAVILTGCHQHVRNDVADVVNLNFEVNNQELLTEAILDKKQVCLQTEVKESQFAGIDKLEIKDSLIYILDYTDTRALFVFDIDGRFLRRIGRRGRGPGEYPAFLMDFAIDNHGHVLLIDNTKHEIHKYTSDGEFLTSIHLPFLVNGLTVLDNSDYLVALAYPYNGEAPTPQVLLCDSLFNKKEEYLTFTQVGDKLDISPFHRSGDDITYHREVNDAVYVFSSHDGALKKEYDINFGSASVPEKLRHDYSALGESDSYRYLYMTPLIVGNYLIGNITDRDRTAIGCFDLVSEESCLLPFVRGSVDPDIPTIPLATIGESVLVSYLDYGMYMGFKDKTKSDKNLINYLENGGIVLTFFSLKNGDTGN